MSRRRADYPLHKQILNLYAGDWEELQRLHGPMKARAYR
jgi:hypothetical protein